MESAPHWHKKWGNKKTLQSEIRGGFVLHMGIDWKPITWWVFVTATEPSMMHQKAPNTPLGGGRVWCSVFFRDQAVGYGLVSFGIVTFTATQGKNP